eukprot:2750352-Amphidinium_carterae.1
MEPCNAPKFLVASAPVVLRISSCGHMMHGSCVPQLRPGDSRWLQASEFTCPMCRSLANCAVPFVPPSSLIETADDSMSTSAFQSWLPQESQERDVRVRVKAQTASMQHRLQELTKAMKHHRGENSELRSAALLEAAAGNLSVTAALSSHQLADSGAVPPTYAVLVRSGLAL